MFENNSDNHNITITFNLDTLKNLLLNLIGSSLLAFGVCAFVEPFSLIVGGATGISLVLHRLLGLNVSIVALAINILVLIPGYIFGSKRLVFGSLLSSLIYPAALAVFERIPQITTIADNVILATVCGGIVCGLGIGLVMKSGGSTGGLDIPVLILHKYTHLPVNVLMNCTDSCIMLAQIPIFALTSVIYGLIYTYIMTQALNAALTFGADRLKVTVISEKSEEICKALTENDYGVTMIFGEGGYTKTPIKKMESIMVQDRYRRAQRIIESIDSTAFMTVETVRDVKGRGYTLEREWLKMEE